MCSVQGVPLHYAVLRVDLATCLARVKQRRGGDAVESEDISRLHARFAAIGEHEAGMIDASGPPEGVAAALLSAFAAGWLAR
jgi:thymidylate kinase